MLHSALIGVPASGKTTLFQLMTSARDAPRGKGDVNIGISKVPDTRLDVLTSMYNPKKRVPATIEFTDIIQAARAGAQALVDVAGYKNADALVHVVRAFRSESVAHASGSIDPARDAKAMEDELILADLGIVERRLERIERDAKKGLSAELTKERELVLRCRAALEEGTPLRALQLAGDDLKRLRGFQFLSAKPLLLVINLDEADVAGVGADVERAAAAVGLSGFLAHAATRAVALCATIELEIAQLGGEDAKAFLADLGLNESGLDRVIRASYDLLGYISFFTVGEDECRAWTVERGTRAQQAAGAIHSDLEKHFIRAETIHWDKLLQAGSEANAKAQGLLRLEGKEYSVHDGDVMHIRHSA